MAKRKKCPHFSAQKKGRWTTMVCTLPAGTPCPDLCCQANPDCQEPDQDDGE